MTGLDWTHPEWAGPLAASGLAAAALLALAWRRAAERRRTLLGRFAPGDAGRRGDTWLLVALAAIALALVGPRLGERVVRIPASGLDLVVLVDVSRSMEARDVPPSRLARARDAARQALEGLEPGDRAALAVFAGHGALLTPLTPDTGALVELLPALDTGLMTDQGSELGAGLEAALGAFQAESARPRVVLLLSDGEHAGGVEGEVLRRVARADARVVAAAFGSDEGARVPVRGSVLRDGRGHEVVSRRDAAALGRVAEGTGGALLAGDRWGALAPDALRPALRAGARVDADGFIERRVAVTRARPLALLALAILLLEAAPLALAAAGALPHAGARRGPVGSGRAPRQGLGARASLVALVALALGASPGQEEAAALAEVQRLEAAVRAAPEDAAALLRLGAARAALGARAEAERAFLAAAVRARDPGLAALATFDLGVAALERGDLPAARDAFFDALALDPGDDRAKYNLEWTLRLLDQAPPPSLPAAEGEGEQDTAEAPSSEPPPESESEAETRPAPAAQGERAEERGPEVRDPPPSAAASPLELDPADAERWLDAVEDDPGRALREAASRGVPGRSGGPRW